VLSINDSFPAIPSLPEIEHIFFMTSAVLGAAAILSGSIGDLACRMAKEYFKIKRTIIEERSALPQDGSRGVIQS
jgi:hypothetical protein